MDNNYKIYYTALYTRLSDDDGVKGESDSIANQKKLIQEYLKDKPEFEIIDTYVDDGCTGTNFERPDFLRLLKDIETKRINCVIVKDLSRFGRNYVEVGRYIERVFPLMGIRFIAINDDFDSKYKDAADELIVPFKNLMNDAYSGDISKKVKSSLRVKKENGEFVGAFTAYGYTKSEEDRHKLEIDEEAKAVVRLIYSLKGDGLSDNAIANILNQRAIPSPMSYKKKKGSKYKSGFSTTGLPKWWSKTVRRILDDETYLGVLEQGKTYSPNYKLQIRLNKKKEERTRVEKAHEAIISSQEYRDAKRFEEIDLKNGNGLAEPYLFSGILRCGDCGQSMVRKLVPKQGKKYSYYVCSAHKADKTVCSTHNISEDILREALLEIINKTVIALVEKNIFLKHYEKEAKAEYSICRLEKEIRHLEKEIEHYKDRKKSLWDDYDDEILSQQEYNRLRGVYESKITSYQMEIVKMQELIKGYAEHMEEVYEWLKHLAEYQNITELDRKVLLYLIDWIYIYKDKSIKVVFKYKDELQELRNFAKLSKEQEEVVYA
ncbi:recombinase family protein [Faecalicatena contorta]|uniref:Site-specific DNA recombinase n=1 Tax=Faecalicatena contorta TaxID=39482 RepID=A0A315ZTQ6_9FIRM|nr:recombinase family protein [Faecalicatena contorta]PWJ48104.1 DNA invertase Pin-like site-specific DNA recombinase [Faecalicatena contorta]SUQ15631.1 Site-specific DNA recombinase [Faecalicatena contorta]